MLNKKLFFSFFLLGLFGFVSQVFSMGELRFHTGHVNVHLYCSPYPTINVIVSGVQYQGYSAYIPWLPNLQYTNVTMNNVPNPPFSNGRGAVAKDTLSCPGDGCMKFAAATNGSLINGFYIGGTYTLQNSGFFRNRVIQFTGGIPDQILSRIDTGAGGQYYTIYNGLLSLYSLNVSGVLGPCIGDMIAPTFGFTGGMVPHSTHYTGAQFNDRIYVFDLRDMGGSIDWGFSSGYLDPWTPDWNNGMYYEQTVLNGSGINLSTFVFEVAVENSPNSSTFNKVVLTGILNYTGGASLTGSVSGLVFYPYGFTWNRWNRNYTGYVLTGELSSTTTYSALYGGQLFGDLPEEEVIMTGYVYDRAGLLSNVFSRHFNHGAKPWSSNQASGTLKTNCGPNGTQTIGVSKPTNDSGAYITKYNDYFVLEPFRVYLHDDWAGIDSGSVVVLLSGTQNGSQTTIVLTGNVSPSINLNLSPFVWYGPVSVLTERGVLESLYNTTNHDRNYIVTVNYTGRWDPETKIEVVINYRDLIGRTGSTVSCSYHNTYSPYVNNWTGNISLKRTPFASGAVLSGFTISFEDEWAGIDSGSIQLIISGRTITNITNKTTSPLVLIFNSGSSIPIFSMLTQYATHANITGGQQYNYLLTFVESLHNSGYFAPEHPISFTLSYRDRAGNWQKSTKQYANLDNPAQYDTLYGGNTVSSNYSNTNYFLININQNPLLRQFNALSSPLDWLQAFNLGTYSTTSGNTQFTGLEYAVMDHWAGVDGLYNLVVIQGYRRGNPATYVFATPNSTGRNFSPWTTCATSNCKTGDMAFVEALVPDYDTYHSQHPTIQASTGYKYQITGHKIYFDYGVFGNSSAYTVDLYFQDLRPDIPNTVFTSTVLSLPSLACQYLSRCSHDQLTFVWGSGVVDMTRTVDMNPLTGMLDGNVVDIFHGTRVSVVGSGIEIDTGTNTLVCNASFGLVDRPITLDFTNANPLPDTPVTTGYTTVFLKVADGTFELTGINRNILVVK